MNKNNKECNLPIIDLNSFDKTKTWLIFHKKGCNACEQTIEYFKNNNIKYHAYDLDTNNGLAIAAMNGMINECEKWVPVIIEDV